MSSHVNLELFPPPAPAPSAHAPSRLPGGNSESTKALVSVLKDNHEKWHIFFNNQRFHNHTTHHVLTIWALGANKSLIEAAYKHDMQMQKPAIKSPDVINETNFDAHLGDDRFTSAYMLFFAQRISEVGVSQVLEDYVFAGSANYVDGRPKSKQPIMLARLMDGLVHAMIHVGFGLEFGLPGMVVEGLAMAAVNYGRDQPYFPESLFEATSALDTLASKLESNLVLDEPTSPKVSSNSTEEVHLFDILDNIMKDERFKHPPKADTFFKETMDENSTAILEYANMWPLNLADPQDVHRKVEELQWMNTIIYTLSGFNAHEKDFFADFFLMHLVTSSLFLPSFIAYLTPPSQKLLLRSYFIISLAWWVSRRPRSFNLDATKLFATDTANPKRPSVSFDPPSWALTPGRSSANPWFPALQEAIIHPDDHLCKIQRAFVHYAEMYGTKEKGFLEKTVLKGAKEIDGSLFIRAAGLTAETLGKEPLSWDR